SALGAGTDAPVHALSVFDDGGGAQLYVGGEFTNAGGASAGYIARWNGSAWSQVGNNGLDLPGYALTTWTIGSSTFLIAGGDFLNAGTNPATRIAVWNSHIWSAMFSAAGRVEVLAASGDGYLYVGGAISGYLQRSATIPGPASLVGPEL